MRNKVRLSVVALGFAMFGLVGFTSGAAARTVTNFIVPPSEGGTILFPGRPLRDEGNVSSKCRVAAYGRVDNKLVIFLPNHCKDAHNEQPGAAAYTNGTTQKPGGVRIGVWGTSPASVEDNDLTYIILDAAWRPTSGLNLIYRGNVAGSDFWTMTSQPTPQDGCAGWVGANPKVYENFQRSLSSSTVFRTGNVTSKRTVFDGCELQTNLPYLGDNVCCPSGTPIVSDKDQHTLAGMWKGQNGNLYFTSFYEGLLSLDLYWSTRGTRWGAWLCTTSSCPAA